jgi:hypothetical protein
MEGFDYSACYRCLKVAGMNGGFGRLTEDEIVFAGLAPSPPSRGGWHNPDLEPYGTEDTRDFLTDAEKRLLQVLADPPSRGWAETPTDEEASFFGEEDRFRASRSRFSPGENPQAD